MLTIMNKRIIPTVLCMLIGGTILFACSRTTGADPTMANSASGMAVNREGRIVDAKSDEAVRKVLPFTPNTGERLVDDYGHKAIRSDADSTVSMPDKVKNRKSLFIIMSKKDFYLYVYEAQDGDTVMIARYDACFSLQKGQKQRPGDMKTPHCTPRNPFRITQIQQAATWVHDFGDGRGSIPAYGAWFLRLLTPGYKGFGIHGSTGNRRSVPGRASEGCIRLRDEDIEDLRDHYAFEGMKVIIKAEDIDDYPFEVDAIKAMEKQGYPRRRHFDASKTLDNARLTSVALPANSAGKHKSKNESNPESEPRRTISTTSKNKTLEEL